ncbi:MAG: hypothetical protein U1D96_02305 [Eubacteriales bacterium]|nr:hypothetical protein [Eubacteriales bacterium]
MEHLYQLILLALLIEAVWETGKMVWQERQINVDRAGALLIGMVVAIGAGVDAFTMVGLPLTVPFLGDGSVVGAVIGAGLTGIILSRGANAVHDLIKRIQGGPSSVPLVLSTIEEIKPPAPDPTVDPPHLKTHRHQDR